MQITPTSQQRLESNRDHLIRSPVSTSWDSSQREQFSVNFYYMKKYE